MPLARSRSYLKRRVLLCGALVIGALPVALDAVPGTDARVARAELIQSFTPPAFTTNAPGAIDIVGNGLLTCGTSNNCINTLNGNRNSGNNSFTMIDLDADDGVLSAALAGQTSNSSMAVFAPPAGSTVLYASLHWSANSNAAARNSLSLLTPGGTAYQTVTGTVASAGSLYQTSANITALVQAAGPGDYWAGNIRRSSGRGTYAGWSMVVVYENAGLPVRNLTVFDGFGRVTRNDNILDVPITGFLTPPFGPVNAEVGVVAYEGDRNISGDQVLIDTDAGGGTDFDNLSDASNPATNFGNGSITDAGAPTSTGNPVNANNLNIDIDEFSTIDVLDNAQTDTTVRFQTTGDWWYPGVLTTAIDLFVPEFPRVTKTVTDLNGGDAVPGDQLEYTVDFDNTGNDPAENSIVRDIVPDDTTFVPGSIQVTNGTGSFDGTQIVAPVGDGAGTAATGGTLNPGESATVTFRVTVDESARGTDIENSATLDYRAQTIGEDFRYATNETVTPVPSLARIRVTKTGTPNPVASGAPVTWTITLTNDGPNPATGVTLTDSMANNDYSSITGADCATPGATDTTLNCTVADLAVGQSRTVTLTSDTDPGLTVGSQITNTVTIDANEEDDQQFNNSATARTSARPESDLQVVKDDVVDPVPAEGTVEYTLTVTNNGPSDARDVRISDQTDGQFTVTAISLAGGLAGTCNVGSRSCLLSDPLPAGATATVEVAATVRDFAGATIENRSEVRSPNPDPNQSNNVEFETTTITQLADVTTTKTTVTSPVVAGEQVVYEIVVANAGPSTASAVTLDDDLPTELTLVSAAPTQGSCSPTDPISCSLGDIGSGGSATIVVTADVAATASGVSITNSATATSPTDTTPGNNTGSSTDTITNEADLRIVKELAQGNPVLAGTNFDFTITVTNDGPSATSGDYTVTDVVPAPLAVTSITGAGCPAAATNNITCTDATPIPPGGSVVITISGNVPGGAAVPTVDNTATVAYADDPNAANNSSTAEVDLTAEADVHIQKNWTSAAVAGSNATFTLDVTNDGPSTANNVVVTDALPGGATFVGATGATCTGTTTISCVLGDMTITDSFSIIVTVALPSDLVAGPLSNTAAANSVADADPATPDRNPDNNDDTAVVNVTRAADLAVTKVATDITPVAGDTVEFTVEVSNAGPSTGNATFVGDALPAGMTLVEPVPTPSQGTCASNAGVLSCDLGPVGVGAGNAVTITYEAQIDPSVADGAGLTNTATANSPDDPAGATVDEEVTVSTEADIIVTKTASADPATPGASLTYTIEVENAGPSDAQAVTLADPVPAGFTATSATSTLGTCDLTVDCTIGTLEPDTTVIITVVGDVDAAATGNIANTTAAVASSTMLINTGDDTGSVTVASAPAADLSIAKSASPSEVAAGGEPVTYTIAVSNGGPSVAQNVEIDDVFPADFVVSSVTASTGGACASATTFPCTFPALADDDPVATVTVIGTFPSTASAGTRTNTATVSSPTDPNAQPGAPKSDAADIDLVESADVSVIKLGPAEVVAGETRIEDPANPGTFSGGLDYEIAVVNNGPSIATAVTLEDTLDPAFVLPATAVIAVVPASAGSCTNNAGVIDCSLGDVAVGDQVTVRVTVDVRPDAPAGSGNLVNVAAVSSVDPDPDPSNDSSTATTDVTNAADLEVAKVGPTQFRAGEAADYTITVTNNGPSDATGVVVTDEPANNVTFGAVSGTSGCTSLPCTIASLPSGQSATVIISATVDRNANNTVVRNTATVSADQPDPKGDNNETLIFTGVIRRADMRIASKDSSPDPVAAGGTITYTIVAENLGPAAARDATLTDTVPADTTLVTASLPAGCSSTGVTPGSTITCELGLLEPSDTATIAFDVVIDEDQADGTQISNIATADSDTIDPDASNDSNPAETTDVAVVADVGIAKVANLMTAVPGEDLTYTLTVTNAGPSAAAAVVIDDDVSAIFEAGSVSTSVAGAPSGTMCDASVNCTLATFPVGAFDIEITGTVATNATTDLMNAATVSTTSNQGTDALVDTADVDTPVAPSADLEISKVASVDPVEPGGTVTYTITVDNNGPSDAFDVEVTDTLPAELAVGEVRPVLQCNQATAVCVIPSLADGTSATIEIDATVSAGAVDTIENTAAITNASTPDPVDENNTATIETDVVPEADVQLTKATVTAPVVAGQTVRYDIDVVNNGPAQAENVIVTDVLPANTTFVNASTPVGTCVFTSPDLVCDLGTLGATTAIQIDVDVIVDPDATGTLDNSVTSTSTTDDPDASNNDGTNPSGATTDPIVTAPDLRVQKSLVPGDPAEPDLVAGEAFEYEIVIINDGPSTALADIVLADTLPPQVSDADPVEAPTARSVVLSNTTDCSYTDATNQIDCTFADDLAVGDSITLTVSGFIRSDAGTAIADNTATATTTDADPDLTNNSGTATATLVTNADLEASKSFDDLSVVAGESTTFTIAVTNNGPSVAADAQLVDNLPSGFTIDSFSNVVGGACTSTATSVTCTQAALAVGATMSVDVVASVDPSQPADPVNNTATASSTTPDRNPSNDDAVDDITVARLADLTLTKTPSAATVLAGNQITYTLDVSNAGPSSAEATVLGDPLPPELTIVPGSITSSQGTCVAPGNVLTCSLGELLPGAAAATVEYAVTFDPAITNGSTITNNAQADSITPLVAPTDASADVDVTREADVELVSKTVAPDPAVAGSTVEYAITARNNGPSVATDTTVVDDLPAGLTLAAPLPAGCTDAGGDLSCDLGTLAVGDVSVIVFDVVVDPAAADESTITNAASISATETDPNSPNDTASVPLTISTLADLTVTKQATPDPAVPGELLTYTLTVTNAGPSDALDVVVSDTTLGALDPATITAVPSAGTCDASVSCAIGTVEPGTANAVTVTITGTVLAAQTADIVNTATVISPTDPTPGTVTISTPVAPVADLGITKVLDTTPPVPGEQVRYTITVTNPGPSSAQGVTIVDVIDSAVTNLAADQTACEFVGQDLTCTIGTLAPGTFAVVVTGDLDETFTGDLANTSNVTTTTPEGMDTNPNSATVTATAAPQADLSLTKVATPDPVIAGQDVTYTITVTNNGPSTAVGVQIDDLLPVGLDPVSVESSQGDCTDVPCELGDLADGATATVTIVATVDANVTDLQPNSASTTSTTPDPAPGNNTAVADPVVTTSADLVTTKVLDTATAVPGTRVSWMIDVANNGPSRATSVSLADSVPSELTGVIVTSSQGGCTAFPCELGSVDPGGSATITVSGDLPADTPAGTLSNTATTTSATNDPVPGDNTATATNPIAPAADLSVLKVGPTNDLVPGQPATFTITVANAGPSDAQAVQFTDTLPAAIDAATITTNVVSGSPTCTTGTPGVSDVECTQAVLAASSSYVVEVTGTVLASVTAASVANTAVVASTGPDATPDPDLDNNTSTSTTDVDSAADLRIDKVLSPGFVAPIDPGAAISFDITVINDGPSDAQNVVVTDVLPADITLGIISTAAVGATCDQGAVTCTFPTVAAGSAVVVTLTGMVSDRALDTVDNIATVASDTADPDIDDNEVTATIDITPFADVQVTKSLLTAPLTAGTNDRYQIVVFNNGPAVAAATQLVDALPDGVVFVSASTPIGSCAHDAASTGGDVTCALGDLPDQASVTITIDVQVEADTIGSLTNTASASSTTTDPTPANNDAGNPAGSTTGVVVVAPDLQIAKSLVEPELVAGFGFTYVVTVKNNGPSDASGQIGIVDLLPAQVDQTPLPTAAYVISSGGSGNCPVTAGAPQASVDCAIDDDLAVGETITLTISGAIEAGATSFDDNTASVSTTDADPVAANNSATASSLLSTDADLVMAKTFAADTVVAGQTVAFDLLVTNVGPSDAASVEFTDVLPAGFSVAADSDITAPGGVACVRSTSTNTDDTVTCNLASLPAAAGSNAVTVTIVATVDPALGAGPVTNTATASSATPDRNPGSNIGTDQVEVLRFADLDLLKTVVSPAPPAAVLAGETVAYSVRVDNAGPSTAEGSVLGDALPAGVTIDPSSIQIDGAAPVAPQSCTVPGGLLTCELGELAPGGGGTITYTVTIDSDFDGGSVSNSASVSSPTPNDAPPPSTTSTGVGVEADLELVSKTSLPTSVNAGEDIEYTIAIRNNGPSLARNVVIDDDLPAGVTVQLASLPSGCSLAFGDVQCQLGDVPAAPDTASTVTRTFSVTVDPDQLTDINNVASVSSITPEPIGGGASNTAAAPTTITTSADLTTTKTASPVPAVPGEQITYTIVVTNAGPSIARAVTVTDTDVVAALNGPITGTWVNGVASGSCDATVACAIGDLAIGTATITIIGTVPPAQLANIVNTATSASSTDDPVADNAATADTPVAAVADVAVVKTIDTSPLVPGQPMQFTIRVTNNGPSNARDVVVNDSINAAMTSLATTNSDCSFNEQLLACAFDSVAPGAGNAIDIVVTGNLAPSFLGTFENTATFTTTTPESTPTGPAPAAPDTASASEPAVPAADVALTKTADPDPVVAGENVTYVITATNNGPSDALGVTVADVLPSGLTLVNVFSSQGACAALPCSLNTVPNASAATVTVVATVDADRLDLDANSASVSTDPLTPDPVAANNIASADPDVISSADLVVTKQLATPVAVPGSGVRWVVNVTNDGPSDAVAVEVLDTVPADVENVVISSSQGGCAAFPCSLGTVPAGVTASITIDAELPADATGTELVNTASASSTDPDGPGGALSATPDPDNTNDSATATNPIVPGADVRIDKVGPVKDVVAGADVSWTLTITNDGPSDAQVIRVTDQLPAALDPASVVVDSGDATCTVTDLLLVCDLAELVDGAVLTVTVDATLSSDFTDPELSNTAGVTSSTADPDTSNNVAAATNDNAPAADIIVTGTATPNSVPAGNTATFEFEVVNSGPSNAAATVVTIPVPAAIAITGTPTVVGFPAASVAVVDGVIAVTIGDLPPGTPVTITFSGDVSAAQPTGPLAVTATGTTNTDQTNTANDVAAPAVDVTSDVDLSVVKTADSNTVDAGDEVTFTIVVTNDGTSDALDAIVNDPMPAGLVARSAVSSAPGGSCVVPGDGSAVTCTDQTVPANGGNVTITIVALATGFGSVQNIATVECDCIVSPISGAPADVEIMRSADLDVTKTVSIAEISPGDSTTFTVVVTNNGPDEAIGVVVNDDVPSGLVATDVDTTTGTYDEAAGRWTIGTLANGASATLTMSVRAPMGGNFTNTATVTSAVADPDSGNDVDQATVLVMEADLPATGGGNGLVVLWWAFGALIAGAWMWILATRGFRRDRGNPHGSGRGDTLLNT
ncbi:MAG: hypothetical protein AB8G14_00385 [Ilumatobacter sp.]